MFGIEVLTWTSDLSQISSPWQVFKHFFIKGSTGHSAIKLTIPATAENTALIKAYCLNEKGKTIIPHYQEDVIVTAKRRNNKIQEIIYYPKKEKGWVVYFSFWPSVLGQEHTDRMIENCAAEVEYHEKWKSYLNVQYKPAQQGLFAVFFGSRLSTWLWPDKVAVPIQEIFHFQEQAKKQYEAYKNAEFDYDQAKSKLREIDQEIHLLNSMCFELILALENEEQKRPLYSLCFPQEFIDELDGNIAYLQNELLKKNKRLTALEKIKHSLTSVYQECKVKLNNLELHTNKNPVSLGIAPTYTFRLPLQGVAPEGLDIKSMLFQMQIVAKELEQFHIAFKNCSSTVLEIIYAGIKPSLWTSLKEEGKLSSFATLPGVVETPDRLASVMMEFDKAFARYRIAKITKSLEESGTNVHEEIVQAQKPIVNKRIKRKSSYVKEVRLTSSKRALL